MEKTFKHNAYGFKFKGDYQNKIAGLNSVGYELRKEHEYHWHGLHRGEKDVYIFQYTLKGEGALSINGRTHSIKPGEAFFVRVPSDHRYYLPKHSSEWEFLYFTTYGKEVEKLSQHIFDNYGHVFKLSIHSAPIQYILETIEKVETLGINHGYEASASAYTFMMKYIEYLEYGQQQPNNYPLSIAKAIQFIEKNYKDDISLDDIVEVTDLSKYHFTREFKKYMNDTPINYLAKIRINKALTYLSMNEKNIEWIALEVGFSSSNYFSKVFKKVTGVSPNSYRRETTVMAVNKIFSD